MNKNQIIIQLQILDPIKNIISKLESNKFDDKDMGYLNNELSKYCELCLQMLSKNLVVKHKIKGRLNEYNKNRFLSYFTTLFEYFNQYK